MPELPKLLEPDVLVDLLDQPNLLIIDLCSDALYSKMHIPGAVHISPEKLMSGSVPSPHKLPTQEKLAVLVGNIGITDDIHVVVYDDEGGGWAGRFIWTLDIIGHKNWSYLNGGLIAWHNEGYPTTTDIPLANVIERTVTIDRSPIIETEEIIANLDNQKLQIWDARSVEEYRGERITAAKNGHIPGAINCDWATMMDFKCNQRIVEDALDQLSVLGIQPDQPTITYCQSHHRSGFTYMLARILNFKNIRAYEGSWSEWGNRNDTPIET